MIARRVDSFFSRVGAVLVRCAIDSRARFVSFVHANHWVPPNLLTTMTPWQPPFYRIASAHNNHTHTPTHPTARLPVLWGAVRFHHSKPLSLIPHHTAERTMAPPTDCPPSLALPAATGRERAVTRKLLA